MAEPRMLKLQSPAYGDPVFYKWPLTVTKRLDEPAEIAETIRLVCDDFPELKYAVENVILKDYNPNDFDSMNQLCQRYNKAIRNILSLWKGRAPPPRMFQPPNRELLRHIINLCYNHAIREPERLNIYEPFSPEVYGETSFDMIAQILDEVQANNEQTFLDLGSGVGQVVLQAAASNSFKECMGVEKADTPAGYAKAMEREFKKWMNWFGKIYTDFTLEKGDFMDDKWKDIINDCGVVFVNNFAFGPVVNHHLKSRFQSMKEGSKIVSSREFVPMNFKFNKRNLSELGAMIRVTEIKPRSETATVSWTGNSVSYFLHIVDRTRLEKYFSILKKKKAGQELDEDEMSLCSESNYSVDTSGTPLEDETLEENLDDLYLGTTTRHQWQLLTDTIKQSKQDGKKSKSDETNKSDTKIKRKKYEPKLGKYSMKQKLLEKYKNTRKTEEDSLDSSDSDIKKIKSKLLKTKKIMKKDMILQKYKHQKRIKISHKLTDDKKESTTLKSRLKKEQKAKEKLKMKNIREKNKLLLSKNLNKKKKISKLEEKISKKTSKKDLNEVSIRNRGNRDLSESNHKSDSENESLDSHVDKFLAKMKVRMKDFIKRINMTEYAERLQVMIECETAKKKLLLQEINETEKCVQSLINDSLHNFSSRLVELDLAVKTPLDLLSKSSLLAEKHQELENKVVNMEIEVLNLEEKYQILGKGEHKKELESKLCGAILSALNHRRSLMDQQSTLSDQISILEKISHVDGNKTSKDVSDDEEETKSVKKNNRPKARPVAFVPPRMLSDNKKNTVSPEASHGNLSMFDNDPPHTLPRRRKRARTNGYGTRSLSCCSDASQGSESDNENQMNRMNIDNESSFDELVSRSYNRNLNASVGFVNLEQESSEAPINFPRAESGIDKNNDKLKGIEDIEEFLKTSGKLLNSALNIRNSGNHEKSIESLSKTSDKVSVGKGTDNLLTTVAQRIINQRDLFAKQNSSRVMRNDLSISTSNCDVASPALSKRKKLNNDVRSVETIPIENSITNNMKIDETSLLRTKTNKPYQSLSDSQLSNSTFKRTSCILPVNQFKVDAEPSSLANNPNVSSNQSVFVHSDAITNRIKSERKSMPDLSMNHIAEREQLHNISGKHNNIYLPSNTMPSTMTASVRNSKFSNEDILRSQYSNPDVEEHFQATFNKLSKDYGRELLSNLLLKEQMKNQVAPLTGMKADLNKISEAIIKDSNQATRLKEKKTSSTNIQKVNVNDKAALLTFSDKAVPYPGHSIRNSEHLKSNPPSDILTRDHLSSASIHARKDFPMNLSSNNAPVLYDPKTLKIIDGSNKDALSVSISFPTFKPDANHHIDVISRSWNPNRRSEAHTDRFVNTLSDLVSVAPDTRTIPTLSRPIGPKTKIVPSEGKPPPKKRGRPKLNKQNTNDKKIPNVMPQNHSNSLIHFQKEPIPNATKLLLSPENIVKNGHTPIIMNAKPHIANTFAFAKSVRGPQPQLNNIAPVLTSVNPAQAMLSNELANQQSISLLASQQDIAKNLPPTLSPRSPTFNHPRFVLLNMPPSVVVSVASNEKEEDVLQRQHSMTSPTFPPPSNS